VTTPSSANSWRPTPTSSDVLRRCPPGAPPPSSERLDLYAYVGRFLKHSLMVPSYPLVAPSLIYCISRFARVGPMVRADG
jgi:hypothetical protein